MISRLDTLICLLRLGIVLCVSSASQCAAIAAPKDDYLVFNGSDQYLEIVTNSSLGLTGGAFTLSAWINPTSWGQNDQGRIIDHGGGSDGASGWSLHLENKSSNGSPQALRVQINNDFSFDGMSDANSISLNTWQHIAVVFDGATLVFFVNGVESGISTGVPVPDPGVFPIRIGMRANDVQRAFDGAVDEVHIWSRALTQQELNGYMNIELTGSEVGLIAYYQFNEGSGQQASDSSGSGNDAVLGSGLNADFNDPVWVSTGFPVNQVPVVNAGPDQVTVLPNNAVNLNGTVNDDGLPSVNLVTTWSVVSGPSSVTFGDAGAVDTIATFPAEGIYNLRLTADDAELATTDDVTITVDPVSILTTIQVTPNPVSVTINSTNQFSAAGYDQAGNSMEINPVWNSTGGVVDATGLYTAGGLIGQYSLTAMDGMVSGEAIVSVLDPSVQPWPTAGWEVALPADMGTDQVKLEQARDYALTGGGSGYITRGGKLVMSWGDPVQLYDLKSTTKSIGVAALGLALKDGLLSLTAPAQSYLPDIGVPPDSNAATGWLGSITLLKLATHTAGFDRSGGFTDLIFDPGTTWSYSDGGANWLADTLTLTYGQDLKNILFDRVFTPLGISTTDLTWRNSNVRTGAINGINRREFSSGIKANVDALARIGYLYLRHGMWDGQQLLPISFVKEASTSVSSVVGLPVNRSISHFNASDHYGYLWWNNADRTLQNVPADAYWAWGLGDSVIIVIPSLDIVASRAGGGWRTGWNSDYSVIEPFITPIVQSVLNKKPMAVNDSLALSEGNTQTGNVLWNNGNGPDSIGDGPSTVVPGTMNMMSGSLILNSNGSFNYTPIIGFTGTDSFSYFITDSGGESSAEATLTFLVTPPNQAPISVADGYTIERDTSSNPLAVLANDADPDLGDTVTITAVGVPSAGATVINLGASLEYTPLAGFSGTETFTYTIEDGAGASATALVTVTVDTVGSDGDLTGDRVVDVRDVLHAYRIIHGEVTPDPGEFIRGDVAPLVDGVPVPDGIFNLGDLIVIQRKALGQVVF